MQQIMEYNEVIKKLRTFFQDEKGFVEVPTQSRLSILAACEDPKTITCFSLSGVDYPLPQTGQMWLEHELLKNPRLKGAFCITTSYRDEPNPIPGRHFKLFPMFEFESHGDINELRKLETELLLFLGFPAPQSLLYENMCTKYQVQEISSMHEERMESDFGVALYLEKFPRRTHPFWNMRYLNNDLYAKIDAILHGWETIGSAERSTNVEEMRDCFFTISHGMYAELLFNTFGKERVMKELNEFLSLPMFPRFGGGIGITRLIRAMQLSQLLESDQATKYYRPYISARECRA